MKTRAIAAGAATALALLIAGCGSDSDADNQPTQEPTVAASPSVTNAQPTPDASGEIDNETAEREPGTEEDFFVLLDIWLGGAELDLEAADLTEEDLLEFGRETCEAADEGAELEELTIRRVIERMGDNLNAETPLTMAAFAGIETFCPQHSDPLYLDE